MGEQVVFVGLGLGFLWFAFLFWWYTRHLPRRSFWISKIVGYCALALFAATGNSRWTTEHSWWLLLIFLASVLSSDLFRIDPRRAPWFFYLKSALFTILMMSFAWSLGPSGNIAGVVTLISAFVLYIAVNFMRPKNALITDDPASTPPAASCPPRSPTNGR
jgi:hypothetical protein